MNYISQHNDTKITNNIFILLVILLLSNVSVFGQSTENIVATNAIEVVSVAKQDNVSTSTTSNNMNFVLWFMGSKQDPNVTISTEGINTKKQIMTSGMAPNRLLIKAFLKKAVNLESSLT
ncbi:hypothetical protein ACM55F_16790 [Flavobacterium sp. XS2P12]|jgi:hypothetical protein|uniref:hypothetical protein n=1 Tax=Flavobacterium melibiosi TaxID=3398734 RepID=UPI003A89505C